MKRHSNNFKPLFNHQPVPKNFDADFEESSPFKMIKVFERGDHQ